MIIVTNKPTVQSPQMSGHSKKGFQPQTLTPLMETSESRTSTISRPAPPLAVSHLAIPVHESHIEVWECMHGLITVNLEIFVVKIFS